MRNAEFVPLVMELALAAPGVSGVRTLAEDGETRYPLGFVVEAGTRRSRWQAIQQLAEGERHENPAAEVDGVPAAWDDTGINSGDAWLAAVIGRAQLPMIVRIDCWSRRLDPGPDEGVTVHFHNGARSFFRRL